MAKKYKAPSYIRPCDKCGQGKGYHSESVDYRLCDTCFREKCDKQLEELILNSAPNKEAQNTAKAMINSGHLIIMGL